MKQIIAPIAGTTKHPINTISAWARVIKGASKYTDYSDIPAEFNTMTNATYKYIPENIDYWSTPDEFLAKKGGDCEDFAIYKFFFLKLPKYFVVGTLKEGGLVHAVCTVYSSRHKDWIVLDCMTDNIITWEQYLERFTPIYLCDMDGVYI